MAEGPVAEIARESPEAADLVHQLVTASMNANFETMDRLYEMERERRQALEVHIDNVLAAFGRVSGGSAREYEEVVNHLTHLPAGERQQTLAAQHHENAEI